MPTALTVAAGTGISFYSSETLFVLKNIALRNLFKKTSDFSSFAQLLRFAQCSCLDCPAATACVGICSSDVTLDWRLDASTWA